MAPKRRSSKRRTPKQSSTKNPTARVYKKKNSLSKSELNLSRFTGKKRSRLA